jgi:hypothetical protein
MLSEIELTLLVVSDLLTTKIFAKPTGLFFASTTLIKIEVCCANERLVKLENSKISESLKIEGIK